LNVVPAFLADTAVFLREFVLKTLPPGAIFKLNLHQNAYAAGHWGKLQSSPDPLAGFQGAASRQGERGRKRGKGEGIAFPHCSAV